MPAGPVPPFYTVSAGKLIPALEKSDVMQQGGIEMNAANSYFWSGMSVMGHMPRPSLTAPISRERTAQVEHPFHRIERAATWP